MLLLGGRYRLDARIGAGGMGEVWRAVDEVLGRVVAVKAMLPGVAGEPGFAKRFLVEVKAMASVNHPAVASIHDYGHSDGITDEPARSEWPHQPGRTLVTGPSAVRHQSVTSRYPPS